ncbi:MAG TPA: ABC transporter ATP-binding protein [Conexibacter sp.]|nr:ABC transporter ATP-binding protein [Conexibacter sp.]
MTLRLEHVSRHFSVGGEIVRAVDDVSLEIDRGELIALYGPSGSGKSTLLLIAAGLEAPDHGAVTWDGEPVPLRGRAADRWRRDTLGVVLQQPQLVEGVPLHRSVGLRLEARGMRRSNARLAGIRMLRDVGLGHRVAHQPGQLSAGQRQRAAIARALTTDPHLILADEPTGTLDSHASAQIIELLDGLARERERAVLIVTHDPALAQRADRVLRLEDGRLAELERDGTDLSPTP